MADNDHHLIRSYEPIEHPFPHASMCDIGRAVAIELHIEDDAPRRVPISIAFEPDDLGWVDADTLRLFEIDPETGNHTLIASRVDVDAGHVDGLIDRSGIYTLVGLPIDPTIFRAVQQICKAKPPVFQHEADWHHPICERVICPKPFEQLATRGRVTGGPCITCMELVVPPAGLPECQLLNPLSIVEPSTRHTRFSVSALFGFDAGWDTLRGSKREDLFLETFDYWDGMTDTHTVPVVSLFDLRAVGFDISVTGVVAVVADSAYGNRSGEVIILPSTLGSPRLIGLPTDPHACEFSPDGRWLYVTSADGIEAYDVTAALQGPTVPHWTAKVPSTLAGSTTNHLVRPEKVSISPDGSLVAATIDIGGPRPFVHLVDTSNHASAYILINDPTNPFQPNPEITHVCATSRDRVLAWSDVWGRMYAIETHADAWASGGLPTQAACVMDAQGGSAGYERGNLAFSETTGHAYAAMDAHSGGRGVVVADVDNCSASLVRTGQFSAGRPTFARVNPGGGDEILVVTTDPLMWEWHLDLLVDGGSIQAGIHRFLAQVTQSNPLPLTNPVWGLVDMRVRLPASRVQIPKAHVVFPPLIP